MTINQAAFNWDLLLKLVDNYEEEARRCIKSGAHLAGLACVRAALETMLLARFLVEFLDGESRELEALGVRISGSVVEVPEEIKLWELIAEAKRAKLIDRKGYDAAERIRRWGNKIHPSQVAYGKRLPSIGKRNVEARLRDLELVAEQLVNSL